MGLFLVESPRNSAQFVGERRGRRAEQGPGKAERGEDETVLQLQLG